MRAWGELIQEYNQAAARDRVAQQAQAHRVALARQAGQRAAQRAAHAAHAALVAAMAPPAPPPAPPAPPAPVLVATVAPPAPVAAAVARKRKRAPSTRPTKAQVLALQAELVKVQAEMENWKDLFLQLSAVVNI